VVLFKVSDIKEGDLPGIGKKFEMELESGEKVVVIVHDEGMREVYQFNTSEEDDDPASSVTMTDLEARQVGSIIAGTFYKPRKLEKLQLALSDLRIEWLKITQNSQILGKSIGDLGLRKNMGINVIACIFSKCKNCQVTSQINPGPRFVFEEGQTIVVAGAAENIKKFEKLI